jgi:hypothetical protein
VLAAVVGAGYAVTVSDRSSAHPAGARTTAVSTTTSAASVPSAPAPTSGAPGVIPFLDLAVGTPPTAGTSDDGYGWHRLVAGLSGPRRAPAGASTPFNVTLRNPTSAPISLDPCPSYDITVDFHTTSYGLNCSAAPSPVIAPGATLTFSVPIPIPRSLSSGDKAHVSWSLGWQPDRTSPQAQLTVTVD